MLGWDVAAEFAQPGSRLGPDPGKEIVDRLGSWSIRLLLLGLSISSLRRLLRQPRLLRLRRMTGLFAFGYVVAHFAAYLLFLAGLDWRTIQQDLLERSYITVGFLALLCLVPLALTSTNRARRRLGPRWVKLHRLVYPITMLGLLHLFWLTKDGYAEPALYLALFVAMMLERLRAGALRLR